MQSAGWCATVMDGASNPQAPLLPLPLLADDGAFGNQQGAWVGTLAICK
jgi:hypothetical protein